MWFVKHAEVPLSDLVHLMYTTRLGREMVEPMTQTTLKHFTVAVTRGGIE